jgi:hypothetical protein
MLLALSVGMAQAQEYGTPAEAKAMLEKAVAAMKTDQTKALEMFTKGEGGFKDRDLYPYCGGPNGNFTAHPKLVGQSMIGLMDKGSPPKPVGKDLYGAAQPGKISEVTYKWTRPNDPEQKPVEKIALVTKVGDEVCAVGYYKQ